MGDRSTGRLGSRDASRDAGGAAAGYDKHPVAAAAPGEGEEAHRAKLAPARRHKRPACETPESAEEVGVGTASGAARAAPRRRPAVDRETFEMLIVREWTKTLRGPYDWGEWPLARYTLDARVLEALELYPGISATGLARACAMVACGRAPRLRSLDPQQRLDGDGQPLVRADGAAAWRCNVRRRNAPDGLALHYWVYPGVGGRIEFEAVAAPDENTATQGRPWHG